MSIEEDEILDEVRRTLADEYSATGRRRGATDEDRKPKLGLRDRIPKLGLTEYWYPAIADGKVPRKKPVRRKLLGQDVVFFRGSQGQVVALTNWCPHRNASLAKGKCLFEGTITCPYHGAVFDENGKALALLGEGSDSSWCDHKSSSARVYPTRTLKGLVFIWMGEGDPAPIEEDVPPEFFEPHSFVQFSEQKWKANWRASLENLQDAHVFFVHRNSIEVLSQDEAGLRLLLHMGPKRPPTRVVNGRTLVFENPRFFDFFDANQERKTNIQRTFQDVYPGLGGAKYPKSNGRLYIAKAMSFVRKHLRPKRDWLIDDVEWAQGVHLPTTFRIDYQSHIYTRAVTPLDEQYSWNFYYNTTYPKGPVGRAWYRFVFLAWYDWKMHKNFSGQDRRIVEELNYENPTEKFSTSDAFPLGWRKMVIEHARKPTRADDPVDVPVQLNP